MCTPTHTQHSGILVQSPSYVRLFTTPWTATRQASLSLTISLSFPKFMSIASVMPSNHLLLCCPLLLMPSLFISIRAWRVSCSHQVAKVLELQYQSLPNMEKVYTVSKKKTWSDCSSDHQLLLAKFRLNLKKVVKTSRPAWYDLDQIHYDNGAEVTNRFKGLEFVNDLFEELWTKVWNTVKNLRRNEYV